MAQSPIRVLAVERTSGAEALSGQIAGKTVSDAYRKASLLDEIAPSGADAQDLWATVSSAAKVIEIDETLREFDSRTIRDLQRLYLGVEGNSVVIYAPTVPGHELGTEAHSDVSQTGPAVLDQRCLDQLSRIPSVDLCFALPSLNTAASIGIVLERLFEGLHTFFPGRHGLFVNADSGSTDATQDAFESVGAGLASRCSECYFVSTIQQGIRPGKGNALRTALTVSQKVKAAVFMSCDTDITSLAPEWVREMLSPLFEGIADVVIPDTNRHKYDGRLTNVLCAPSIHGIFGVAIRQPLSGVVAYNGDLVDVLIGNDHHWRWPVLHYGVELSSVITAAVRGLRFVQPALGVVRHAPRSLMSVGPTIVQILEVLLERLTSTAKYWTKQSSGNRVVLVGDPSNPLEFEVAAPDLSRMRAYVSVLLAESISIYRGVLPDDLRVDLVTAIEDIAGGGASFEDDLWARTVFEVALASKSAESRYVLEEYAFSLLAPAMAQIVAYTTAVVPLSKGDAEELVVAKAAAFARQRAKYAGSWQELS